MCREQEPCRSVKYPCVCLCIPESCPGHNFQVPGRFAPNPFPPLDVSPPGRFAPGRFAPGRFAPTGRFAPGRFVPQISMRGGIGGINIEIYVHEVHRCGAKFLVLSYMTYKI